MDFTLVGLWNQMGPVAKGVVIILLIMSMYSLGITVERVIAFTRGKKRSMGYVGALAPLVASPGRLAEAAGLDAKFKGSPVAKVVGSGIGEYLRGLEELKKRGVNEGSELDLVEAVGRTMERVKEREIANLRRGLSVLATVSSSAPFVGLFGTVFGIITAFQKMADPKGGGGGLGTVSAGIAEALLTTAVGLGVAIVAVWFYNFFTGKVDDFTVDIDETSSEFVDSVVKEARQAVGSVRAGQA